MINSKANMCQSTQLEENCGRVRNEGNGKTAATETAAQLPTLVEHHNTSHLSLFLLLTMEVPDARGVVDEAREGAL